MTTNYEQSIKHLMENHEQLITRKNSPSVTHNGIFQRYEYPILTAAHTPIYWRYDLNESANPYLMERLGVNATFNAGAIYWKGKYLLVVRVEGVDRKSFFAIAESTNGIDNFRFWDYPIDMPETNDPDTNIYDMRLTVHEDEWIYGLFCTERKDHTIHDTSSAIAQCGIARTRDLKTWERLSDLKTPSKQQRNVVLHPEFINGKYGLYTRPQDGFITVGGGGGIGWGMSESMNPAILEKETVMENRVYHTIKELKNGQGPTPLKTKHGWLHLAHGVRNTAAGLRYTLYVFMSDLQEPWKVIHQPAGHFIAPEGEERIGDVSNVTFSNGWIVNEKKEVFIYYGSSDTRLHVATTTLDRLVDYTLNTPEDGLRSATSAATRKELIRSNLEIINSLSEQS